MHTSLTQTLPLTLTRRPRLIQTLASRQGEKKEVSFGLLDLTVLQLLVAHLLFRQSQTLFGIALFFFFGGALRPQKPSGVLGTGSPEWPPRLSHSS